jgi:Zn finger protein HypA/HybF involved in hydrogenase expression
MTDNNTAISLDKLLNGGGALAPNTTTDIPSGPLKIVQSGKNTAKTSSNSDNSAKTLESYHSQNIQKIREEKAKLPHLRKELQQMKQEFFNLEKSFSTPAIVSNAQDIVILTGYQKMEQDIQALEDRIKSIESGETESDYFLRVGDILFSYTDAQDRIAAGEKTTHRFASSNKKTRMPANSVYSYFASESQHEPTDEPTSPEKPKKASEVLTDIGFHRDKALENYLSTLDPNNIQHDAAVLSTLEEGFGNCPVCNTEMLFNETFLDCSECGYREYILIDSEKPSYKDPPREMSYYAYKKINHLNEWLAQFQAKETTEIPAAVLDQIKTELRKERITDMSKLKISKLKEVLKKLKLSRCYDHVAHILNRLNGISAPVLSREVEEKLRFMFKEIQFSFVKHCPKKRSNFLSYSFVLYKFCELLELDEYLPCFPLLKSREKLYMQDKIWELICKDLDWQFIRTV